MKWRIEEPSRAIIPTPAIAAIVHYGLYWVWFLWMSCTLRYTDGVESTIISGKVYGLATGFNLVLIGWLCLSLVQAWKRRDSMRVSHLAGSGLGVLLLLGMQFGLHRLHTPIGPPFLEATSIIETWQEMKERGRNPFSYPLWK